MKVVVLGAGLVGRVIAADLATDKNFQVSLADRDEELLAELGNQYEMKTRMLDLRNHEELRNYVKGFDLAVSAAPGPLGFETSRTVLEAGVHLVDIAFFAEDPRELISVAKEQGITAVIDCGVAPGLSNLLVGHVDTIMDEIDSIAIYVGGLPQQRRLPFEYKAVFSPIDVIDEYLRPARFIVDGRPVTKPALSELEQIHFPEVGTLEAFATDGLRTLLTNVQAKNMREKTLRYPGHCEWMEMFRECGFFDSDPIELQGGTQVVPLELTSALLFDQWKLETNEHDLTVMRVIVEGAVADKDLRYTFDLFDRYDSSTGFTSMARTTGFMATSVARSIAAGVFRETGLFAPEELGRRAECVTFIERELKARGVQHRENISELQGFVP